MTLALVITALRYMYCAIMMLTGKSIDCNSIVIPPTSIVAYPIMLRSEWGAKPPKSPPKPIQEVPVPFVILHDTPTIGNCNSAKECMEAMRKMQMNHQDDLGWNDIDYSFVIGNNGLTIEGHGWDASGADAPGYNEKSISICIIGNYSRIVPDDSMLTATKNIISFGQAIGKISANYTLLGHRQVRNTDCPGKTLFNKIQQWPHWRSLENKKQPFPQISFPGTSKRLNATRKAKSPKFPIMPRKEWGAKPSKSPLEQLKEMPISFVIIHDTLSPGYCNSTNECKKSMRELQRGHQEDKKRKDIEYNFCIGYNGLTMEGSGWDFKAEHARGHNESTFEFALIGDFNNTLPDDGMVKAVQGLINYGISIGKISPNYTLLAHREVDGSYCPGDALFKLMKKWPHWRQPDGNKLGKSKGKIWDERPVIKSTTSPKFPIMPRKEWGAKPSKSPLEQLKEMPISFVIIHDTLSPGYCNSTNECKKSMRELQRLHQEDKKWKDIEYSFCIGYNGLTMEGRGWDFKAEHARGHNESTFEFALIGDFNNTLPDDGMVKAVQGLINYGISIGKISPNYTLLAHREVDGSYCPGDALFKLMKKWPHWRQPDGNKLGKSKGKIWNERPVIKFTTAPSFPIITRKEWGAKPSKAPAKPLLEVPVPFVILHDTLIPKACNSTHQCKITMKDIQENHQDDHNYNDIEYSFCIGYNGLAMEGRGWDLITENAPGYYGRNIEIALIGDFSTDIPNIGMVNLVQGLINYGISIGKISPNYTLLAHRQLIPSKCPGDALFDLMKHWPHWGQPDAEILAQSVLHYGEQIETNQSMTLPSFPVILRREWGAKPPKASIRRMKEVPVPFVIIHDTRIMKSCNSMNQCKERMREIQQKHQDDHNYDDIDFSFCIGSNGITMEAIGWDFMTKHTPGYYGRSIEIALLGNYKNTPPDTSMVNAVQELINYGINQGKISPNYTLLAHRQIQGSNCPGDALFNLIKRWPHWGQQDGSAKSGIKVNQGGRKVITTTPPSTPKLPPPPTPKLPPPPTPKLPPPPTPKLPPPPTPKLPPPPTPKLPPPPTPKLPPPPTPKLPPPPTPKLPPPPTPKLPPPPAPKLPPPPTPKLPPPPTPKLPPPPTPKLPPPPTPKLPPPPTPKLPPPPTPKLPPPPTTKLPPPPTPKLPPPPTPKLPLPPTPKRPPPTTTKRPTAAIPPPSFPIMSRREWGAKPPKQLPQRLQVVPVPFVILHDTLKPKSCHSVNKCKETMRELQRNHQDDRGYEDIVYSFCFGHNGLIMEGRGWDLSSRGTPEYNKKSISIAIIGDYTNVCPSNGIISAVQKLINYGISIGKISPNYTLLAHRQLDESTKCPGNALFKMMKHWPHWGQP